MSLNGVWKKSTRSGPQGGACIEVRRTNDDTIQVRDSKNPHGPVLAVTRSEWGAFINGIKADELPR